MCGGDPPRAKGRFDHVATKLQLPFPDAEPYRLLKVATEVFMMAHCGVVIGETDQTDIALGDDAEQPRRWLTLTSLRSPSPALDAEEELRLPGLTDQRVRSRDLWDGVPEAIGQDQHDPVPGHHPAQAWRPAICGPACLRRPAVLRNSAQEAHQALPAGADLELLARGRHAGPDHERAELAIPEPARTT